MEKTRLQKARLEAGMSQSQLAAKAGISLRTLQHYEIGDRDIRKAAIETGLRIADALGCNINDIL